MSELSPEAWNERYKDGNTPWDLSGPTPEFVRLLEEGLLPPKGRVLVPGGGRGHDAILFAQRNSQYEVALVDFAPEALQAALVESAKLKATVLAFRQNFFDLPSIGYHQANYDLILEYTFFCAIAPELRPAYVKTVSSLLKSGGLLAGLFFPLTIDKPGPPFAVSQDEVEKLFQPYFDVKIEKPQRSVKPREGREFLGLFRRK